MDLQKIIRISAVFLFAALIIILALVFFFEKSENRELEDFEKVLKCINNSRIEAKTINEAVK